MPTFGSSTPEIRNYFGIGAGLVSGIGGVIGLLALLGVI
ncbi:hypothetical protein Br6_00516 [Rhodococcus sp. Br-6]|jgi:hypothetical protein|nr:hypothetical protein Br6_00516 [Rhodococcus sp. Br-6]SUE05074.1 Uncharacterised protein [Prescottella equi]SUE19489.1 Uncharacterised protein [Prescottella equi]